MTNHDHPTATTNPTATYSIHHEHIALNDLIHEQAQKIIALEQRIAALEHKVAEKIHHTIVGHD